MTKGTIAGLAMLAGLAAAAKGLGPELQRYMRMRQM
jgi:hypothetical protein